MGRNEYTWKPGQSGNPKGRAKKQQSLTDILKKQGNKKDVEINGKKYSKKEALAIILWQMALNRNLAAIRYIYDRIDGIPTQTIEMEHDFNDEIMERLEMLRNRNYKELGFEGIIPFEKVGNE